MSPHAHTRTHTHAYTHTLTHTCTVPALRPNWPAANRATQTPQPAFPRVLWKTDWHCPAPAGSVSQKSRHAPSSEGLLLHTQPARPPTPKEPPNESLVCQLRVHRHAWALPDDLTVGQTGGDARKSRSVCGPDLLLITDSWGSGGLPPCPHPPDTRLWGLGGSISPQLRIQAPDQTLHFLAVSPPTLPPFHTFHAKERLPSVRLDVCGEPPVTEARKEGYN